MKDEQDKKLRKFLNDMQFTGPGAITKRLYVRQLLGTLNLCRKQEAELEELRNVEGDRFQLELMLGRCLIAFNEGIFPPELLEDLNRLLLGKKQSQVIEDAFRAVSESIKQMRKVQGLEVQIGLAELHQKDLNGSWKALNPGKEDLFSL